MDICPAHNDTNRSLSIKRGHNGRWVFHCFGGCDYRDIRRAYFGNGAEVYSRIGSGFRRPIATNPASKSRNLEVVQSLLQESKPVRGTLGEHYLNSRGITSLPDAIRFHPKLWHSDDNRNYAGLLLSIPSLGQPIALHRTYLSCDGAKRDRRRLSSPLGHGAYLLELLGPLVVGEGLESTLSWWQLNGAPSCTLVAALDAATLCKLDLPDLPTKQLIITPDNDVVGMRSADELRRRAVSRGWKVEVNAPPPDKDWNDILMERIDDWW